MKNFCIIIALIIASVSSLYAQDEPVKLKNHDAQAAAQVITGNYNDWQTVTLNGKLDLDGVAISPSVKIYMVRDKKIVISIRVPLMGEVATVDISPSQVTLVNKVKKTWCRQNIADLMVDLPVGLADLQDLFLGRIFLPNYGTLTMQNFDKADIYVADDVEGWFVLPKEQPVQYNVSCGYNTYSDGRTDNIFVSTLDAQNQATAYYTYDRDKYNIEMVMRIKGKDHRFDFRINDTEWGGKPVKPAEVDNKYTKVSLSDFFKHLI